MANHLETFPVVASESVQRVMDGLRRSFQPDGLALSALAELIGTTLPPDPRVLVLHHGEEPDLKDADRAYGENVPTFEPGRYLLAYIPRAGAAIEPFITRGVAKSLVAKRRAEQGTIMNRAGAGLVAAGAGVSGVGYGVVHNGAIELAGGALFAAGAGLIAYASNRGEGKLPDLLEVASPVQVVDTQR